MKGASVSPELWTNDCYSKRRKKNIDFIVGPAGKWVLKIRYL